MHIQFESKHDLHFVLKNHLLTIESKRVKMIYLNIIAHFNSDLMRVLSKAINKMELFYIYNSEQNINYLHIFFWCCTTTGWHDFESGGIAKGEN